jgi:ribosomal protein L21E
MLKHKRIREKGKLPLSRYFQELLPGDKVAVVRNLSVPANFPKRIHGLTGIVKEKRGSSYIVELKQGSQVKKFIIEPLHLKKIKTN